MLKEINLPEYNMTSSWRECKCPDVLKWTTGAADDFIN